MPGLTEPRPSDPVGLSRLRAVTAVQWLCWDGRPPGMEKPPYGGHQAGAQPRTGWPQ